MGIINAASKFRQAFVQAVTPSKKNDRVARLVEELTAALDSSRPRGVELPHNKFQPEERRDVALAVEKMMKQRPGKLKVVRTGTTLSVFYAADLDPLISGETRQLAENTGLLLNGQNGSVL